MTLTRRDFTKSALSAAAFSSIAGSAKAATVDVVVIGAGAAGLSATNALQKAGFSVTCVEASNRIGGRVFTETSTFGLPFDQGAHWLHNKARNPFVRIGKKLGLTLYKAPASFPVLTKGGTLSPDKASAAFERETDRIQSAITKAAKARRDVSARDVIGAANDWTLTASAHIGPLAMARDMAHISVMDWYSAEGGADWFCAEGFGTLLTRYGRSVPVSLKTKVSAIDATANGVTVRTSKGNITAKAVVCTVSQGVLASGAIRFTPRLDRNMQAAIGGINMGSYNHIALHLKPGALDAKADSWITYQLNERQNGGPKGGGILANINGSGLSYLEVGGGFGKALERHGSAAMIDFAVEEFSALFGSGIRKKLITSAATQWGKNPYVLGAYSGASPGKSHLREFLSVPHAERVFFAGEATSIGEQATVSGAHKEGLRAAKSVTKLLRV